MLKVNEEEILKSYNSLLDKKEKNLAKIEVDAKAYAVAHGYDEDKTVKFVEFTQGIEGNGLTEAEDTELTILGSYIEEVEEEVATEEATDATAQPVVNPNASVNVL